MRRLTPRVLQVVQLACAGYRYKSIADTLNIELRTVKSHMAQAFNILGVCNKIQLTYYWNCELFHIGISELNLRATLRNPVRKGRPSSVLECPHCFYPLAGRRKHMNDPNALNFSVGCSHCDAILSVQILTLREPNIEKAKNKNFTPKALSTCSTCYEQFPSASLHNCKLAPKKIGSYCHICNEEMTTTDHDKTNLERHRAIMQARKPTDEPEIRTQ